MELIRVYAFPAVMVLGALWLTLVEVRHFRGEKAAGPPPWLRLVRRLAGAGVLVTVAAMVHLGDTAATPGVTLEETTARFHYWMVVLGLVLLAVTLAIWDILDGLGRLRTYLDGLERDEVQTLRQSLRGRKPRGPGT